MTGRLAAQAPEIFGRGAISSADPEFGLSLSPDGKTAYFNRASADRSRITAMESHLVNGAWQPATPVPFADTAYRDLDLFMRADGLRLFFSSNRPVSGAPAKRDLDLWYISRPAPTAAWGKPVRIPEPVNSSSVEVFTSITTRGTLYFASDRGGNSDIYRAEMVKGGYATVERLPDAVNTPGSESNPMVAPDESFLIFVAERPEGLGGGDLYVTRRVNGQWTQPRNLGAPVNSPYLDFAPGLSPDGKYLFFTSERPGVVADSVVGRRPGDIYRVELSTIPAMRP
jgi:Tol biopolymer transport system component